MAHATDPAIALAELGRLVGDPARARMLARLLDGRAATAGELAREAGVTPQTASGHLRRLAAGGLVTVEARGRHRYVRLAGAEAARALEALGAVARAAPPGPAPTRAPAPLRFARLCFDHLAGQLAVELAGALEARGLLAPTPDAWELTPAGAAWCAGLGVALPRGRRAVLRRCMDWSERRDHVAGALGAALAARVLERRWLARVPGSRQLRLTVEGRRAFGRELGLRW